MHSEPCIQPNHRWQKELAVVITYTACFPGDGQFPGFSVNYFSLSGMIYESHIILT